MHQEIRAAEEALRQAMLADDIAALDTLIAEDLAFVLPNGHVMSKQEDMDAHRAGRVQFTRLDASDWHIRAWNDTAVVLVQMQMTQFVDNQEFSGTFRFTRVWRKTQTGYAVVAGHYSLVPPT